MKTALKITVGTIAAVGVTYFLGLGMTGMLAGAQTVVKTASTITVQDDGTTEKTALRATETIPTTTKEQYTMNDLISEIASLDTQIAELQAQREKLVAKQTALQTELDKLPVRTVK